jgi:hypothetical protein
LEKEPSLWNLTVKLGLGIIGVVAFFFVLKVLLLPLFLANTAVSTAKGVVSKTMDPNNVITKYEYFHDANAQYLSRRNQIIQSKTFLVVEQDPAEKQRLRIELAAQQQSCRDLVTRYNANATKTNVSIFQGREAPESLNIQTCE